MTGAGTGRGRPMLRLGGGLTAGVSGEHSKDPRATTRRLLTRLRPEGLRLLLALLVGIISVGFQISGPKILGNATNVLFDGIVGSQLPAGLSQAEVISQLRQRGQGQLADLLSGMHLTPGVGVDLDRLGRILAPAAAVYLAAAVFSWAQGYLMAGITQRAMYRLRGDVEDKLARLPLGYFDSHPHGDILSRVANDIDNLSTTLQQGLSQLLTSLLTLAGVAGMMFWISPWLAAVSLVIIPLALVTTLLIARRAQTRFSEQWDRTGTLNGLIEETHTGHTLVLAFGRRTTTVGEFRRQNRRLLDASFRAQFLSSVIQPAVQFLGNLNYVVIAVLGGYRVASGAMSLGDVQGFIQYSRQFTMPLTQIAGQMNMLRSGLASAERVFEFLDATEQQDGTPPIPSAAQNRTESTPPPFEAAGHVQLEHVSFRYDRRTPLIEDFSLEAQPGQTVAIVGPTGAGKTTVVNLLMRFYEIDSGRIVLDGVDYRDLTPDQVRRHFGMVLQDTWLFAGSIRDNIAYGRKGATDQQVIAAARAARLDHFVRTLPDGYDTILDEDASNISAGQKQLLTIARAFLADPTVLILDEATSNVDTRTEVLIQQAMLGLRRGRTSFVIAHRLSTIRNADTIVVMDSGHIVEQGPHESLLQRRGVYFDLYNSQFSGPSNQPEPVPVPVTVPTPRTLPPTTHPHGESE